MKRARRESVGFSLKKVTSDQVRMEDRRRAATARAWYSLVQEDRR